MMDVKGYGIVGCIMLCVCLFASIVVVVVLQCCLSVVWMMVYLDWLGWQQAPIVGVTMKTKDVLNFFSHHGKKMLKNQKIMK